MRLGLVDVDLGPYGADAGEVVIDRLDDDVAEAWWETWPWDTGDVLAELVESVNEPFERRGKSGPLTLW